VPALPVPEIAGGNPVFFIAVFLLGYLVMADVRFQRAIDAHRLPALLLGPVACLVVASLDVTSWPAVPAWAQAPLELYLGAVLPWCCLVALLAYGRRFLRASGRLGDYAAEASYPVYLLHQTVIVLVAFVVVRWEAGVAVKFTAVLLLSLLVTMLAYELAVRRADLPRFLFGMKPLRRAARALGAPADGAKRGLPARALSAGHRDVGARPPVRPTGPGSAA
jgi:peptidoglycan/LPS O-acetylase OafA/YrhL